MPDQFACRFRRGPHENRLPWLPVPSDGSGCLRFGARPGCPAGAALWYCHFHQDPHVLLASEVFELLPLDQRLLPALRLSR